MAADSSTQVRPLGPELIRVALILIAALAVMALLGLGIVAYIFRDPPDGRPEVAPAVYAAVRQAGNGGTIDFRRLTNFDWDRMYVFGSYTTDDEVSHVLGFTWGTGDNLRLPRDELVMLVFAKDARVTGWVVLNGDVSISPNVYFSQSLIERSIPRDAAIFELSGDMLSLASSSGASP